MNPKDPMVRATRSQSADSDVSPGRRPAMVDVARIAGVSHQTVSRVLNAHPNVSAVTRSRVMAAIKQLDYRRNVAARALATGRSQTIGVVCLDSPHYGPASTLYGIEHAARTMGYLVSVATVSSLDRMPIREAVGRLTDHGVDGVVVIAPLVSARDALKDLVDSIPAVAAQHSSDSPVAGVTVDQVGGARAAVEHLLGLGHETVWHIAGPSNWLDAQARLAGWQQALRAAGAEAPPPLNGDWTAKSGYDTGQILTRIPDVSAVFAANDQMALGLIRALVESGRRVPDDISVVGFDDIPEAGFFLPPLTTVRQDFEEVGRCSLRMLIGLMDVNTGASPQLNVGTELVVRASTASRGPAIGSPSVVIGAQKKIRHEK